MDKRKLIANVARKTGYAKWEINSMLNSLCESMLSSLQNGEKVTINEFGTFSLKVKKKRVWVHPQTKERREIPERIQVVFTTTRKFTINDEAVCKLINNQPDTQ